MPDSRPKLESFLAGYDKELDAEHVAAAEAERKEFLSRFPLAAWPQMPLEKYAIGQENSENNFCRWAEFATPHLGSMRGGSSRKLIIYWQKDKNSWWFTRTYKNENEAWSTLRDGFCRAFQLIEADDWDEIDAQIQLVIGPLLLLKTLHLYFPTKVLSIYSQEHLRHFLRELGDPAADNRSLGAVALNQALLANLRKNAVLARWTTNELERFLYRWADPRELVGVYKIAPGEEGKYWDDCLKGGYICVGWDEVGDLREFDSKEAFRIHFDEKYTSLFNGHGPTISRKANELWMLFSLQAGDQVIANRGTSRILAVGKVIEPGYFWNPERQEYRHCVHVEWDTSLAKNIKPKKAWALVTVAAVPSALYEEIVGGGVIKTGSTKVAPLDPVFRDIGSALERKGQVVLYGPPGTGKTYTARRFAVAWLLQQEGRADVQAVLNDRDKFVSAERDLSTTQVSRRVWWIVANPKEWNWDRLAEQGKVSYRQGRLQRNYPLVKVGDLVIGYQSNPDKRIVALARVTRALSEGNGGEPSIELSHLTTVKDGLTYDELLADPVLKSAEPLRFRNQGTLFALTPDEAEHVLALLAERNPEVQPHLEGGETVGFLTRLTFHPSYSYEDFVEGFRPVESGEGALSLRLDHGIFKRVCHAALARPAKKFLVLIDEINRANIAKVFGELVTLLEMDKRGLSVTLPQSKESFCIPPNLYVLGTMNTADRSIKLLDAALRRRFAFVELMPDSELLQGGKVNGLALDEFLEELNRRIARSQGREKQIGHSFLLDGDEPLSDPEEFARRFRQEILPLLQEYCYEDYGALAKYIGSKLVCEEAQTLNYEYLDDATALIAALEDEFSSPKGTTA
jgi:5-methylcytosine-specific restriction protein B